MQHLLMAGAAALILGSAHAQAAPLNPLVSTSSLSASDAIELSAANKKKSSAKAGKSDKPSTGGGGSDRDKPSQY
jgi:hypothetical protein